MVRKIMNIKINKLSNIVIMFFSLFAISLPFHAIEYDLFGLSRFEIKITMITFILLFIVWLLLIQINRISYRKNELIIYSLAFIYVCSQYLSLVNSAFPIESFRQSIIITCLATMMIICSQMVIGRETAHYVIISMAFACIIVSSASLILHYFFNNVQRLGQVGDIPFSISRGDPTFFGDIILYGLGPFYYVVFIFCSNKLSLITIPFQIILFFTFANTHSKGVLLSVLVFFIVSILFLKGKRLFMMFSCVLFLVVTIVNVTLKQNILSQIHEPRIQASVDDFQHSFLGESNHIEQNTFLKKQRHPPNHMQRKKSFKIALPEEAPTIIQIFFESLQLPIFQAENTSRLSLNKIGLYSYDIRLKAMEVSLINSFSNIWFGNGAGTSQILLPKMANEYDKTIGINSAKYNYMVHGGTIGEPAHNDVSMTDSHNVFLTEFFNVGIIGSTSLLLMICLILYEQIKVIRKNNNKNIILNVLLFATLLSMLTHRMTASFVVIPFLWFILGLNLGIIRLPFSSQER